MLYYPRKYYFLDSNLLGLISSSLFDNFIYIFNNGAEISVFNPTHKFKNISSENLVNNVFSDKPEFLLLSPIKSKLTFLNFFNVIKNLNFLNEDKFNKLLSLYDNDIPASKMKFNKVSNYFNENTLLNIFDDIEVSHTLFVINCLTIINTNYKEPYNFIKERLDNKTNNCPHPNVNIEKIFHSLNKEIPYNITYKNIIENNFQQINLEQLSKKEYCQIQLYNIEHEFFEAFNFFYEQSLQNNNLIDISKDDDFTTKIEYLLTIMLLNDKEVLFNKFIDKHPHLQKNTIDFLENTIFSRLYPHMFEKLSLNYQFSNNLSKDKDLNITIKPIKI